jgi:uncharacterized RDD family membrane protein YckC
MVEPRTAAQGGERVHVVGLCRRVAACFVDGFLLSPVLLFAGWLAFRVTGIPATSSKGLRPEAVLDLLVWGGLPFYSIVAVAATIALLYSFLFVSLTGKTPGLRVLSSRVINVYGERPEWWRSLVRCIALLVGLIPLGLGLLWIGFDREKRGLHDWLAGTYVIRTGPAGG